MGRVVVVRNAKEMWIKNGGLKRMCEILQALMPPTRADKKEQFMVGCGVL